jgi:hypothetical protein
MRTLKIALFAALLVALLPSCVTQRKCLLRFPPPPADTVTSTVTKWRDTTLYVPMPADTVRDSIDVVLPCPEAQLVTTGKVTAKGKYATADAWLDRGKLKIKLVMNDVQLKVTIDSAIKASTKTSIITQHIIVEKKVIPPLYRASLFVNIFLIVFVAAIFYIALRRKP